MNRLKFAILLLLILLALLTGCSTVGENGTHLADVPLQEYDLVARGGTPVTPDSFPIPIGGGRTIPIHVMNPAPTATLVLPTAIPILSATASATPTATMIPTNTPQPTDTATPTATATLPESPTPTLDVTILPPVTPGPPKSCELVVTDGRNVRSGPGIDFAIVGSRALGNVVTVDLFEADTRSANDTSHYLWGRIGTNQWLVVLSYKTILWWVWAVEGDVCTDVDGYPPELVQPQQRPSTKTAFGWHMVPGGNGGEVAQSLDILSSAGYVPALKSVSDPNMISIGEAHGAVTVFRSVIIGDCPNVTNPNPVNEAQRWAVSLDSQWFQLIVKPDYFEVSNECDFQDPAWWNSFGLEIIRQAQARGWGKLVLPTFAPGHQEQKHAAGMKKLWLAMLARGDCVGIHAYGIAPGVWVSNSGIWLGYRHRLFHQWLIDVDPRLANLKMCITEVAAGAGNDPVTYVDAARFWKDIQGDPYVVLISWWYAGTPLSAWPLARLDGMLNTLAEAIIRALQSQAVFSKRALRHTSLSYPLHQIYAANLTTNYSATWGRLWF